MFLECADICCDCATIVVHCLFIPASCPFMYEIKMSRMRHGSEANLLYNKVQKYNIIAWFSFLNNFSRVNG